MYYSWEAVIPVDECESIIAKYKDEAVIQGTTKDTVYPHTTVTGPVDLNRRNVLVSWINPESILNRAIATFMEQANERYFNYRMTGSEQMQFSKYEVGGKYCWHRDNIDIGSEKSRKLTTIVQLSNPDDYEGGDFQFYNGGNTPKDLNRRQQGSVVVFDSADWHRISSVTKGARYSLTQWSHGPKFI
tara:strand:+ start:18 stop:578 length:561 start_codon:yes stop_codon:yes gene_type:complete